MNRNGRAPQHVTDFRKTQPLTGEPPSHATEAWILSTPEGLAVAFRNTQPASVPRTQQRVQRDFEEQVDRINVIVDFDGDGRTGYNFRVSSTDDIYDGVRHRRIAIQQGLGRQLEARRRRGRRGLDGRSPDSLVHRPDA